MTSKAHFVASVQFFEIRVFFSIFTFLVELQNVHLDRERTETKILRGDFLGADPEYSGGGTGAKICRECNLAPYRFFLLPQHINT